MATLLKRYYYDGGRGTTDRSFIIGYCKEEPIEVLEKLIKTHCIHSYKQTYCEPISEYPANCDGIMIFDYNNDDCDRYGITITKSIDDYMNNEWVKKYEWNKFSLDKFLNTIGKTKTYYQHFDDSNNYKDIYRKIYKDFSSVYSSLIKAKI